MFGLKKVLLPLSLVLIPIGCRAAFKTDVLTSTSANIQVLRSTSVISTNITVSSGSIGDLYTSTVTANRIILNEGLSAPFVNVRGSTVGVISSTAIYAVSSTTWDTGGGWNFGFWKAGTTDGIRIFGFNDTINGRYYSTAYTSTTHTTDNTVTCDDGFGGYVACEGYDLMVSWYPSTNPVTGYRVFYDHYVGAPDCYYKDVLYPSTYTVLNSKSEYTDITQCASTDTATSPKVVNVLVSTAGKSIFGETYFSENIEILKDKLIIHNIDSTGFSGSTIYEIFDEYTGRTIDIIKTEYPDTLTIGDSEYSIKLATDTAVSGNLKANSTIQLYSRTSSQIRALTPSASGQTLFCSDCSNTSVCISTGTSVSAWGRIQSRSAVCD